MKKNQDNETLLIIDMQPGPYDAAQDTATVKMVVKEIKKAKKKGIGIVVLEYNFFCRDSEGSNKTATEIMDALEDYRLYVVYRKDHDDGSWKALSGALRLGVNEKKWRVCGVNIDYCVFETVKGLLNEGCKVTVVKKACNSDSGESHPWSKFRYIKKKNGKKLQLV